MSKIDSSAKRIESLIDHEVRKLHFTKSGKKWIHTTPETICRLTLTKNRWKPDQHYLDIAVSIIQLNCVTVEEPVWHIIGSVYSPLVEEKVEWEKCLNIRYDQVTGKSREIRLVEILQERIMPFLRAFESLEGIKKLLSSNQLRGMGVRTELQELTGYKA